MVWFYFRLSSVSTNALLIFKHELAENKKPQRVRGSWRRKPKGDWSDPISHIARLPFLVDAESSQQRD
jgi:hypothetical protein